MSDYPYRDGDFTVLGPEIFASKGGSVICWKGENYVRQQDIQTSHGELITGALHEIASALRDVVSAIRLETAERPDLAAGPTVAEAAAQDRAHWHQKYAGDQP